MILINTYKARNKKCEIKSTKLTKLTAKTVLSTLKIKIIHGLYHLTWKILYDLIKTDLTVVSLLCNVQNVE